MICAINVGGIADDDNNKEEDGQLSDDDDDIEPLKLGPQQLDSLLSATASNPRGDGERKHVGKMQESVLNKQYVQSKQRATELWGTHEDTSAEIVTNLGNMHVKECEKILVRKRQQRRANLNENIAFDVHRNAAANWLGCGEGKGVQQALAAICKGDPKPNQEQLAFLKKFAFRLQEECRHALNQVNETEMTEPMLDLVHGFPGTGKSALIAWMQEIMEKGLGWKPGIQYVCLAFSNVMATHINGQTIHRWTGIPVMQNDEKGTGDKFKQSVRTQAIRVILIDEVSMVSAELLGAVEKVIRGVVRIRNTFKKREDKSIRAFGGINVIMFADFWQLPPVTGTYLCSNPTMLPTVGLAAEAMNLFWAEGKDSVRGLTELHQLMRCRDPWFNRVLSQCRNGALGDEDYNFLNGFPTLAPPETCELCTLDVVHDKTIGRYKAAWMNRYLSGERNMNQFIHKTEARNCIQCQKERLRRDRVWKPGKFDISQFCDAPALYSFNIPKYFTMLVRAQHFAQSKQQMLTWTYARDKPMEDTELLLDEQAMQRKLVAWLGMHDQNTSNLTGLLPLVIGLPVRLPIALM